MVKYLPFLIIVSFIIIVSVILSYSLTVTVDKPPQILEMWMEPVQPRVNETFKLCVNVTDDTGLSKIIISIPELNYERPVEVDLPSPIRLCNLVSINNSVEFKWLVKVKDKSNQISTMASEGVVV